MAKSKSYMWRGIPPLLCFLILTAISSLPRADRGRPVPRHVGVVQFDNQPSAAQLEADGVRLLQYMAPNRWLASYPALWPAQAPPAVLRVRPLSAAEKYDAVRLPTTSLPTPVLVALTPDADWLAAHARLQAAGAIIRAWDTATQALLVSVAPIDVPAIAADAAVLWLAPVPTTIVPLSQEVRGVTGADVANAAPYQLDGAGVRIAIFDFGIIDIAHPDFQGRFIIRDMMDIGAHATNVAGIMAGSGINSESYGGTPRQWRGVAPAAELVTYDKSDPVTPYVEALAIYGVDVSQNSWGIADCTLAGQYNLYAPLHDNIVRGSAGRPVTLVFAAGNLRDACEDADGNPLRYGTVQGSSQSAKNTLTVGAVNDNDAIDGAASSWGPTADGRLKPEIVSDGVDVKSAAPGGGYTTFSGTSQAAPSVSGAIALLLQHYRRVCAGNSGLNDNLLPATLKALLAHTAVDLNDSTSHFNLGPDFASGYGRLDVPAALDALPYHIEGELVEGGSLSFVIEVAEGTPSLKFTLAWDDPAAAVGANPTLVNNLDLLLIAPNNKKHGPWLLDPTPGNEALPATRSIGNPVRRDSRNTLEQVVVDAPVAGTWTIEVTGTSVPVGPQTFGLVGEALPAPDCAYVDQPPTVTLTDLAQFDQPVVGVITVTVAAADIEATALDVAMTVNPTYPSAGFVDVEWAPLAYDPVQNVYAGEWDSTTVENGLYTLEVRAVDDQQNSTTEAVDIIVFNDGDPTAIALRAQAVAGAPPRGMWLLSGLLLTTGVWLWRRVGCRVAVH